MHYDDTAATRHGLLGGLSRRAALRGIGGGLLAAGFGLGGRAAEAIQAEAPPLLLSGIYVGEAAPLDAYVALIAGAAANGAPREVSAYVCDGTRLDVWFTGQTQGNLLELAADDGSRLEAVLTPDGAAGTIALTDGVTAGFAAPPATGVAGLYDVTLTPDGELNGADASSGSRLAARVVEELDEGTRLVAGVLAPVAGSRAAFATFATADAEGELRLIVLPSGQSKGGGKKDHGHGFIEQ